MRIRILPSAIEDLVDGFRFYDSQVSGLGSYFLETMYSEIESLKLYSGIHIKVFGYHRLLSKRFPFAIYYHKDSKNIYINAILDCRRDPEWIKEKLKDL